MACFHFEFGVSLIFLNFVFFFFLLPEATSLVRLQASTWKKFPMCIIRNLKLLAGNLIDALGFELCLPCENVVAHSFRLWYACRAECANNPVRFFAIMSMQRSGSGWFETLLNSHINVSSNGEIFNVYDRRKNISSIVKTLDKIYNLDWFNSASKNECSAAVGFKWMLNQVNTFFKLNSNFTFLKFLYGCFWW